MDLPSLYKYSGSADVPIWPTRKRGPTKPVALWLSVEDAWERWCHREEIFLDRVAWRRPVTFRPGTRVTVIDNLSAEFDSFTDRYADPSDIMYPVPVWDRVAADMDALILWPWAYPGASLNRWDLTWDCPSGVVFAPHIVRYGSPEERRSEHVSCVSPSSSKPGSKLTRPARR